MFPGEYEHAMTDQTPSHIARYRARKERQGFVRVEVNVRKEDVGLVRRVAAALSDPLCEAQARTVLRQSFAEVPTISLKALLASAPFDEVDLSRSPDPGRSVDL
jgi:hypothetical protein